ncbi:MAG: HlyD family efflux transporter periplasmic adaptor subunit [Ignavibacteriales bacterium]|nr:HlyD family efflux transporter periplasmic adaptor subunit [Ignavibacteriales bacterium]
MIIFLILPIEYPRTIKSKGKLLPYKTWTLAKGTDGRLITSLNDNLTGINDGFTVTQFERGDAVQFKLKTEVISKDFISKGDTIGYVISNIIEKDIEKLKGELETAKASLNIQTSSEKESVIDAEKSKLVFAEKELEEQTKVFDRKKLLFERQLISQQEYEADEAKFELAKINVNIAKERLRTVQSGAKKEEINFAASQISALENEIRILQKRYESNNIVTPIGGNVNKTFSSDTLLVINDTSKNVILIPVKWSDINKIQVNQSVIISSAEVDEVINGKIISIGNNVKTANNFQYVLVTVISEDRMKQLKSGLYVDCKIECGSETALDILSDFLKPIFK